MKCYVCDEGEECAKSGGKGKETECPKMKDKGCHKTIMPDKSGEINRWFSCDFLSEIIYSWRIIIPFNLIHIVGKQVFRGCLPFANKEGCFDTKQMFEMQKEFEQAGQAVGQVVEQEIGNIAGTMDLNRQAVAKDGEGCICKKDLCNFSPVARTSSLMTVIFVAFLQIL